MAKYTVGQEVWTAVSKEEADRLEIYVSKTSPLSLKGTVSKIEGTKYIVLTTAYGDIETTEELIDLGMKANGNVEDMRKFAEECARKREEARAARESSEE